VALLFPFVFCIVCASEGDLMRIFTTLLLVSVFILAVPIAEGRQYNLDYLLDLVESENDEGVKDFFAQRKYVKNIKHIIEFGELFREKLEKKYGVKPSWREAYDCFKSNLPSLNYPKDQEKQFLEIFKEITKQFEKSEKMGMKLNANALDSTDSFKVNEDLPGELAAAFCEALGGGLLLIIPSPVTYTIGGVLLGDSAQRTVNYLLKKEGECPRHYDQEPSSSHGEVSQPDCDRDSWDREY